MVFETVTDKYRKKDGKRYRKTGFENELSTIVLHVYYLVVVNAEREMTKI